MQLLRPKYYDIDIIMKVGNCILNTRETTQSLPVGKILGKNRVDYKADYLLCFFTRKDFTRFVEY